MLLFVDMCCSVFAVCCLSFAVFFFLCVFGGVGRVVRLLRADCCLLRVGLCDLTVDCCL